MRPNRFCTAIIVAQAFLFSGLPLPGMTTIGHAADGQPPAATESTSSPAKTVDTLFTSLKKERNAVKARSIANQIASEWNDSGSATINLLMQWAGEAADEKRNAAAYDFLDQVILLDPDYVQAPYRRAMVHFSDGDTRKAMADINLTLEKEPRYFPALASLANILEASGRDELALKAWERYLALYPADKDARKQAVDLSEKLAGTRG
nr:tetratricopeptide repeat protein [uncultured Agrobacterium sp.]